MDELLRVENLKVVFEVDEGELTAVDDVSFSLRRGETLGLVGESGCGKSVTAMSLLRLIPSPPGRIVAGQAMFEGRDLLQLPIRELRGVRGRRIGMIFQEPMTALSPLHRIGKQLVETLSIHQEMDRTEAWRQSIEWLTKVGIPEAAERMSAYPFEFSGGMRQRVMIAMALMHHPALIIADEPTTALDVTIQAQVFELMAQMKEKETSLLLITHDMGVIWELCDRVLVMYASRLVEEGAAAQIFSNPLHPYTSGLLQAVPRLTGERTRLTTIPGQVPSPLDYPPGCHFADRCAFADERCRRENPRTYDLPDDRRSACFLAEKISAEIPPNFLATQPPTKDTA